MTNPILVSSARRRMRSVRTSLIFTVYATALMALAAFSIRTFRFQNIALTTMRSGIDCYIMLALMQFLLIVLVAPAMTAGAISGERERQTLDLMLVTDTGSLRIVIGKFLEGFLFLALLILSSAPFMAVVLLSGGIGALEIAKSLLFLLVCAFAALSVGLFASALFKRTATSTVVAYLAIFAIGALTLLPLLSSVSPTFQKYADDPALVQSMTAAVAFSLLPKVLLVSPAIGLFSLLTSETELMRSTFRNVVPRYSGTYYVILEKLGFERVAMVNMGIMLALALALILISALLVRPRVNRRRKK